MTKEELKQLEAEVRDKFGEPSSPYDEPNESYNRIKALRTQFKMFNLAKSRAEKKANGAKGETFVNQGLEEISASIPKAKNKEYTSQYGTLPIYLTEADLVAFTDEERDIVICYMENTSQSPKQIGDRLGITYHKVTRVLRSTTFGIMTARVMDSLLKQENFAALRRAQMAGDTQIIKEVAKHYGNLSKDSIEITNKVKPIDDPEMIKYIKALGDKLVNTQQGENK